MTGWTVRFNSNGNNFHLVRSLYWWAILHLFIYFLFQEILVNWELLYNTRDRFINLPLINLKNLIHKKQKCWNIFVGFVITVLNYTKQKFCQQSIEPFVSWFRNINYTKILIFMEFRLIDNAIFYNISIQKFKTIRVGFLLQYVPFLMIEINTITIFTFRF